MRALVSPGFSEGHALPALALTAGLVARGHDVTVELSLRWREAVTALGADFAESEEYVAFPGAWPATDKPTVVDRARALAGTLAELNPDLVVADFTSPAPALAAELVAAPLATLIPTVYPVQEPNLPPLLTGFAPPRTAVGAAAWRLAEPVLRSTRASARWNARVPSLLNDSRRQLGLPALGAEAGPLTTYGQLTAGLTLVATFPQLEYPRRWPASVRVIGPLPYELPHPAVELPPGDDPLVLVASSTVPDPRRELVRVSLEALADEPVRVIAALNRRGELWPRDVPENARVVDWLPYSQVMPAASAVISSGGAGTVARALCEGTPLVICPNGADTAENGARVTWSGAGLALPSALLGPSSLRLVLRRVLSEPGFAARAAAMGRWHATNDGATRAAELLERYADDSS
jgi:MGT family glycosyltransferase